MTQTRSRKVGRYVVMPTGPGRVGIREARHRRPFVYCTRAAAFRWLRAHGSES